MNMIKTLVLISNYFNHHQKAFCDEMYTHLGEGFKFVETMPMEDFRSKMGWGKEEIPPYVLKTHLSGENDRLAYELADKTKLSPTFKIVLSANFASFCQQHAVPINYTVYKDISSPVGKDIYAWLVYRNNGLSEDKPVFVPRDRLVEQFMPVSEESDPKIANVNYSRIIEQIKEIKEKYYPELKVNIDSGGTGITLYKSPTPVLQDDVRYALISSSIS